MEATKIQEKVRATIKKEFEDRVVKYATQWYSRRMRVEAQNKRAAKSAKEDAKAYAEFLGMTDEEKKLHMNMECL